MTSFVPPLDLAEVEAAFGGRFSIVDTIAAGGQGAVFKAVALADSAKPTVALKVYFEDQVEERAAREVNALRALRGDTIVRLVDEGNCDIRAKRCIYIATSFIDGETLASALGRAPLPFARVAEIGRDIALAIDELWKHRVVHRDIKPPNIMLATSGRAVLIDLGLARHLTLSPLTSKGSTWGTEGYLSPEQARGAALTCRSDVFALGIVLQEALLGRHPTNRRQTDLLNGGPRTAQLITGVPADLASLVDSMVTRGAVYRPLPRNVSSGLGRLATPTP